MHPPLRRYARLAATLLFATTMLMLGLGDRGELVHAADSSGTAPSGQCQNPAPTIAGTDTPGVTPQVESALKALPTSLSNEATKVPSLAIAVVLDQHVIFAAGFGCADIAKSVPATPQTIYKIESLTKVFEATMAMQQRDAGNLILDKPVDNYVPQVYYADNNGDPFSPTFAELASHTSGLKDFVPNVSTLNEFWRFLEQQTAVVPVGQYFYSDFGFVTLSQAVSIIAGQDYHDYVNEQIFQPLGMTSSSYDYTPLLGKSILAIPYKPGSDGAWDPVVPGGYQTSFPIAGNIFTSVTDMAQVLMLQFQTAKSAGGSQILACHSLQQMWKPVASTGGNGSVTLGWFSNPFQQSTLIWKNGGNPYWSSLAEFIPDDRLGVVAFTNTGDSANVLTDVNENLVLKTLMPLVADNPPVCAS
jgi:CubicO group peptidase (beta-lactamase class C family)